MSDDRAMIEIGASSSQLEAGLRAATSKLNAWAGNVGATFSSIGKSSIGSSIGNIVGGLANRGMDFVADQARAAMDFEERLVRMQIASGKSRAEIHAFGDSVRATSSATGIAASDVLAASEAYVRLTGDIEGAVAGSELWAKAAQATGARATDIAETVAALKKNLQVDPGDMEAALSAISEQGKAGAVELKDLAARMSDIAPLWSMFEGGKGLGGLQELGATLQIVKGGFGGDAVNTVTGLRALLESIQQNAGKFGAHGIKVFNVDKDGTMRMRSVLDVVDQISDSKLAKNPELLAKAFGRTEAARAFFQIRDNRQELERLVAVGGDAGAIGRDFNTVMESGSGKAAKAWEQMKNSLAEVFTPDRIEMFAKALGTAAEQFANIVGYIDRIAKHIDDLRKNTVDYDEGQWIDETAEGFANQKFAQHALKSPEEKLRMADIYDQMNTDEWKRMASGGEHTRTDKALARSSMLAAFKLRESAARDMEAREGARADVARQGWADAQAGGGGAATIDAKWFKDRGGFSQENIAALGKGLAQQLAAALKASPLQVNLDGNKVDDELANSTNARRRP